MLTLVQMKIVFGRKFRHTNETGSLIFQSMIFIVGVRLSVTAFETGNCLLIVHVTSFV